MSIQFRKISNYNRGMLFDLLVEGYSFDYKYEQTYSSDWRSFDDFFFDRLEVADRCGFITVLDNEVIGFASWDPRNIPEYVIIGHNCIIPKYKGNGYGKIQLQEAVNRITLNGVKKIIVTTDEGLVPAQRMYKSIGFKECRRWADEKVPLFKHIDYELINSEKE